MRCRALEEENARLKEDAAIDGALGSAGARNPRCVRALLDRAGLRFENGTVQGLEEQIQTLREQEGYLFYPREREGCFGLPPAEATDLGKDGFLMGFGL